jgi:integrase
VASKVRERALDTRNARAKLKVSGKPYYRSLGPDLHLGYRKGKSARRWVARIYVGAEQYKVIPLGHADDLVDADGKIVLDFWQAQDAARVVGAELLARGDHGRGAAYTVAMAVEDYILAMEGKPTQKNTRDRLAAYVDFGERELADLKAEHLEDWMRAMVTAPPRASTARGAPQNYRELLAEDDEQVRRRKASANRVWNMLRAALNLAFRRGRVPTDAAWRRVQPFSNTEPAAARYLTVAESKRLVNAVDPEFRPVTVAALMTGARFTELARLQVKDFNPDSGTLHVRTSKSGRGRHIILTEEGAEFFSSLVAGRLVGERMFGRWGAGFTGASRRIAIACERARIRPKIVFHELRHTWASLSVMGGMPLMVVAKNLGHRDTRMVEKHYGHLAPSFITESVRKHAPRFGVDVSSKVTPLR